MLNNTQQFKNVLLKLCVESDCDNKMIKKTCTNFLFFELNIKDWIINTS